MCYLRPTDGEAVPAARGEAFTHPFQVQNRQSEMLGESDPSPPTLYNAVSLSNVFRRVQCCALGIYLPSPRRLWVRNAVVAAEANCTVDVWGKATIARGQVKLNQQGGETKGPWCSSCRTTAR